MCSWAFRWVARLSRLEAMSPEVMATPWRWMPAVPVRESTNGRRATPLRR